MVDDSTNTPLPLANIFIAGSTIGTAAGNDGKFQLNNVPYGIHKVVVSFVGYKTLIATIDIVDTNELECRLNPEDIKLSPVVVQGNEPIEWKGNLEIFISKFFGNTPNAKQCKLLNPEVLDFAVDENTSEFTATVREPLIIENEALGYRLYYYLKYYRETNKVYQFYGVEKFEQLDSESAEETEQWKINRRNTYYGSRRHFFYTLFHKNCKEEGFEVKWIPRRFGLSDGFYNGELVDKYKYIGYALDPDTLLAEGKTIYERKLSFPDIFQVTYEGDKYNKKISRLELEQKTITVYSNGEIAEPLGILTFGYWSTQRAAELLPWDYKP